MKERCRDGCRTSLLIAGVVLVPNIFHTLLPPCHPYITIHFMEMIFSTCKKKGDKIGMGYGSLHILELLSVQCLQVSPIWTMGVHCCCLHVNYNVYKHFDWSLHVVSSDPTCVQISDLYLPQFLRYWDSN